MEITGSYPAPTQGDLSSHDWDFFQALPAEYRRFLSSYNGGFVRHFQYSFLTGVPYKLDEIDNPSRDDCPVQFFGIPTTLAEGKWPNDLLKTAVDHETEQFLPRGIIAIATFVENSLVCISLRENDYGQIYYWDWYWQYPWCKSFFVERFNEVKRLYPNAEEIQSVPDHPDLQRMIDDFNYATIVKLADNFNKWIESCVDETQALPED